MKEEVGYEEYEDDTPKKEDHVWKEDEGKRRTDRKR